MSPRVKMSIGILGENIVPKYPAVNSIPVSMVDILQVYLSITKLDNGAVYKTHVTQQIALL
jgi:hypothetical protein